MATKTLTGLYETREIALDTASELKAANIAETDISIVAAGEAGDRTASDGETGNMTDTGVGQGAAVGGVLGGGLGLAAGLGALVIPGIGPVLALGWLLPAAVGAAVGASGGGVLGALIGAGVNEEHAHVYAEGVRRGGSLVTVRADDTKSAIVEKILARRSVNPEARATLYRTDGWTRFDETADPDVTPRVVVEKTVVREMKSQPRV